MTARVTVTGASGFVGHALCQTLTDRGLAVRGAVRSMNTSQSGLVAGVEYLSIGDIGAQTDWSAILSGTDSVIHCAARAHVMRETESDALAAYRALNVEGTRNLAEQAAASGVRRLIFLSSIKVNGENTYPIHHSPLPNGGREVFSVEDEPSPEDAYGISKWEAEQALREIAARTDLEVVIIRPPLVYGPGVKGNFLSMLGWLNRGIPLPLGAIHNKRSLVGIDNLVDLIITCIDHPAAANNAFLVSDNEDLSTNELLRRIANALGKTARPIYVPQSILQLGAQLIGRKDIARRLLGNLQVDISKTKDVLDWEPPASVDEVLHKTAEWYLRKR